MNGPMTDILALPADELAQLRDILEAAAALPYVAAGVAGARVFRGGSARAVTGFEAEEFRADPGLWFRLVHADDRALLRDALGRLADGDAYELQYRIVRRDGEERRLRDSGRAIRKAAGEELRLFGMVTDISGRHLVSLSATRGEIRSDEALNAGEEQFRRLLEAVPTLAVQGFDRGGTVRYWNKANEAVYGYSAQEAIGRNILDLVVPPELRQTVKRQIKHGAATGEMPPAAELWLVRKDGSRVSVYSSYAIVFTPDSEPELFRIDLDLTPLKRAEEQVRDGEARFRLLIESTRAVSWEMDASTLSFRYVSPQATAMLGYPVDDWYRPGFWEAKLHPDERERVIAFCRSAAERGRDHTFEFRMIAADGHEVWIEDIVSVDLREGQPARLRGFLLDITDRRLAERAVRELNETLEWRVAERTAELEYANKELESFSYSVSHDLRAPLRAINGFAHILLETEAEQMSPDGRALLDRVRNSASRMGQLIDDILRFSRISRAEMTMTRLDLGKLARSVAQELSEGYPGAVIEFGRLPQVTGDESTVRLVLANLVENALKFSSRQPQPRVEIGTARRDGQDWIFVRDNGVGFDMRYTGKLFGVFQRMHPESQFPGMGVGLAIVKRVVDRHHGRVWAESEPGQGATFFVSLGEPRRSRSGRGGAL
ncbi:MAG: sensor signal transduction histidine kinase [Proteobacteria bacterium]|nr:sensor signal transduction histidine kinase [Pseudomonadota bacterium]